MHRHLLMVRYKPDDLLISLYVIPDNIGERFVTWASRHDAPEDTFWGHYFRALTDALADFNTR